MTVATPDGIEERVSWVPAEAGQAPVLTQWGLVAFGEQCSTALENIASFSLLLGELHMIKPTGGRPQCPPSARFPPRLCFRILWVFNNTGLQPAPPGTLFGGATVGPGPRCLVWSLNRLEAILKTAEAENHRLMS